MASFKYTMVFDYSSGITGTNPVPIRIGGWTESYYANDTTDATVANFVLLMTKRLGMCARGTSISKYRIQAVDPAGASQLFRTSLAAPVTWLSDVPQMALKIPFQPGFATGGFLREFRGVPDVQVTVGEYTPTQPYTAAVSLFLEELGNGIWRSRRRDKTRPKFNVLSIDPVGAVVMTDAFGGIAVGNQVQVIRTVNPMTGRKFGYFARVQVVTDTSHFQIVGPKVRQSGFGQMRLAGVTFDVLQSPRLALAQAVVRKVGRPFRSYSGRASRHQ